MLLHYFGEDYPKCNCAMCDNCLHPKTKIEAQKQLLIILQAVKTLKENFRQEYVIDFVRGRATDDQKDHKHDELDELERVKTRIQRFEPSCTSSTLSRLS